MTTFPVQPDDRRTAGEPQRRRPRLGFLGVGWIGRHRLEAVAQAGSAEIVGVADSNSDAAEAALQLAPAAVGVGSLHQLLDLDLDGLVIATPSAMHAAQAVAALDRGTAVFCQKPLARTETETREVIEAARRANRLLAVDLSYRYVAGVSEMRRLIASGALGRVYAADLTFHNAYGPDKPWFYDPKLSGGGCVTDLGTHLVDLALWMCDFPQFDRVSSRLYRQGRPVQNSENEVEDYAFAQWDCYRERTRTTASEAHQAAAVIPLAGNGQSHDAGGGDTRLSLRLACSWGLPAGRDAVIEAAFYGTEGAVSLRNVDGSFYDFVVERFHGTRREQLAGPPDSWGRRAIADWVGRLSQGMRFDPSCERLADTAALLDAIYRRDDHNSHTAGTSPSGSAGSRRSQRPAGRAEPLAR